MARVYAEVYSPEELRAVRAFYESEVGKKWLDKNGVVAEKLM